MNIFYQKNRSKISKAAILIILLVLIRSLADGVYHLNVEHGLTILEQNMYLTGSLIASISSLLLILMYAYRKYTSINILFFCPIAILLYVKSRYMK